MMTVCHEPGPSMFSIAMFGIGYTGTWFGLSHGEIPSNEEKLEHITKRLGRIIEKKQYVPALFCLLPRAGNRLIINKDECYWHRWACGLAWT
ncbi:MAG: hypothetical protein ABSG49_10085 [Methanoregula sp.]|uniref:hypothetical protein n=1 Tax=Methanoregula sp. TaxID=2052170 RepID=UPI003C223E45